MKRPDHQMRNTDSPTAEDPNAAAPGRSAYITPRGAARLRAELDHLWKTERPLVTSAVHEAAKNGDRSENGDYIYGKRRLREIDRRVRYLSKRLEQVRIVSELPTDRGRVFFGAWVSLEDEDGVASRYRIVGPDESDVADGTISIDSPLARALLGKRPEQAVEVGTPAGMREYTVIAIEYEDGPGSP